VLGQGPGKHSCVICDRSPDRQWKSGGKRNGRREGGMGGYKRGVAARKETKKGEKGENASLRNILRDGWGNSLGKGGL